MTPKTAQNQKVKNFKKLLKEASNQKSLENKQFLELKNIKNDIFENFKNSKITPKIPKNQKVKNFKKSLKEASNQKSLEKTIVRIEKY